MPCDVPTDDRLKDVGIADLPYATHGLLRFQPVKRKRCQAQLGISTH